VHRGTIFVEDCEILAHESHPAGQWRLRIHAPRVAANAEPGSFVHLSCDPLLPMRRPMSLMRTDADSGWVDILYKEVGHGTKLLAGKGAGVRLSVIGPIGRPFEAVPGRPRALLLGGGVGIPPMVFLADRLRHDRSVSMFVVMGSEVPFPFETRTSDIAVPGLDTEPSATMPLLERWGVAARLASGAGFAGCHRGYVTDLARIWLDTLGDDAHRETALYACGPAPMLEACVDLAREYALPCRVSLEEYMACAVGGCAGCAVRVRTGDGRAMKRVCVDGPVFDGHAIVFGA
jgi:dihydroorotate dehydrogenase electron transfer subunit